MVVRLVPHGGLCAFGGPQQTAVAQENPPRKADSGNRQSRERSGERNAGREHGGTQAETEARPFDYAVWDEVLGQLTAHCTAYKTITLTQTEAQVARQSAMRRIDRATFDPRSGRLAEIARYEETPASSASAAGSMRSTRVRGAASGRKSSISLPRLSVLRSLTGYWLWWRRWYEQT